MDMQLDEQALAPEQTQMAGSLLARAKQESVESGEVVRLILAGVRRIDSWLIEQHIVPSLRAQHATTLHFTLDRGRERRSAVLLPFQDGSAFARSTSERWSVLERLEALSAVQYIGFRYAPDNDWAPGFEATFEVGERPPSPLMPLEVAAVWAEITGMRPAGFETGALDEMEALGLKLIGRIFNSQGRLGL